MGDQKEDHGHHAITREAVRLLFLHKGVEGPDHVKRVDGMDELTYFNKLDAAQRAMDVYGSGKGEGVPKPGTAAPAALAPQWQREHAMADPNLSGAQNLERDRQFVEDELNKAHDGGKSQFSHLGAATHALEDSYSEAHMFRGSAVNQGDPTAPIQSIHVWEPRPHEVHGHAHGKGLSHEQGTHDERFDAVPVLGDPNLNQEFKAPVPLMHASDRAAAAAVAEMLESFHAHEQDDSKHAAAAHHETIGQFFQAELGEQPKVNKDFADPAWEEERDRRLAQNAEEEVQYQLGHHENPDDWKKHPGFDPNVWGAHQPGFNPDMGTLHPSGSSAQAVPHGFISENDSGHEHQGAAAEHVDYAGHEHHYEASEYVADVSYDAHHDHAMAQPSEHDAPYNPDAGHDSHA